jgi:hypothetical protein
VIALILALAVLPASAASKKKAAEKPPSGVFQAKGYYFNLPKSGESYYRTKFEASESGEQVYVYPPTVKEESLGDLSPGGYGKHGIVKVEVVRPDENDKTTFKALEQQTIEDFKSAGAKVDSTDLSVLKMPGFYARIEGKEKYALFVLQGKGQFYYVTSGIDDVTALEVVRSFGEGKAPPPPAPSKPEGPADPFGGKKLHYTDTRSKGEIDADKYRQIKEKLLQQKQQQSQGQ